MHTTPPLSVPDAEKPPVTFPHDLPEPDKQAQSCQTWLMTSNDGAGREQAVARELAECRQRGIDRLDVDSRKQIPVPAPELQELAARYAATQPVQARGRIAQIKQLLRGALRDLHQVNPTDAALIRNLFFGDEEVTARKYATDLLKYAQAKYGERDSGRFLEIRNTAFRSFSQFLIEFVDRSVELAKAAPSPPFPHNPESIRPDPSWPMPAGRRIVHYQQLVAVLQFSLVDPGDSGKLTIEEHQALIAEYGRCWWGWFRAAHDVDYYPEIERRLVNCEVGLWERSENLFYIAQCNGTATDGGRPILSPDTRHTPDYYRAQPYPAWFNFRSIRKSTQREFAERFGDLPNTRSTIYWSPDSAPGPVTIKAHGNAILQISDLRFGEDHRWSTASAPHRTFTTTEEAIARILLVQDMDLSHLGAVAICGNFSSDEPSTAAFQDALAFIDGLCEQLPNITRDHVVVVPGADDFHRPGDRERSGQSLYREFHQNLYGGTDPDLSRMRRFEFDTFRLNILPVNSVKMLGIDENDEGIFGYGYDSQLNAMRDDHLRNHSDISVINAIVAHHHIMTTPVKSPDTVPQEPVGARVMIGMHDARDIVARLDASHVALYLHGHLHQPDLYTITSDDNWRSVICSAGTAGASDLWLRSRYRDNHGNSIAVIDIAQNQIRGRAFVYDEDFRHSAAPFKRFEVDIQ
jgi:hypothetical protein